MKRIALLATLVVLAVLTMPAHTKEPAEKISVIIANDPGNPVPIDGSVIFLQQEISKLMSTFNHKNEAQVVDGYEENSSWLNFVTG